MIYPLPDKFLNLLYHTKMRVSIVPKPEFYSC